MFGRRLATLGLMAALGSSGSSAADAGGGRFDPGRVRWSELDLRASKLTVTATAEVRLSHEPVRRASECPELRPSSIETACTSPIVSLSSMV